jgi:hypothetical protein
MAESNPSLFIPFVFENISETRIYRIFDELALGRISRIDIVPRRNTNASGKRFNNVIIRFEYWYENREAQEARRRIGDGKEVKIVYYKEYFWKVSAYIPKTRPINTPRLILDDEESQDAIPKKRQAKCLFPQLGQPAYWHDTDDELDYRDRDDENNT